MTPLPPEGDRPTLGRIELSIEARLRELVDAGELSGFPGEGKPIAPEDLAGDDAAGRRTGS